MIRIASFIIIFFYSNSVFGQFNLSINDTLTPFGSGACSLKGVISDSGNVYISGILNNSDGQQPFILKFDENGQIVNRKKYVDTLGQYALFPYNAISIKNNQIIVCGQFWSSNGTLSFAYSFDKNTLDTIWKKVYLHPDTTIANQPNSGQFSELTSVKPTSDNGYILTGNYNKDCILGNLRSFIMKIDYQGNVEWRKTYSNIYGLFDIEQSATNGYVLINKYFGPFIIETDSLGTMIWEEKINSNSINATVSDLTHAGGNCFVGIVKYLCGGTISNPIYGLNIFKVDLNSHQLLWDKTYKLYNSLQCVSMHQAMGVEVMSNGDIVVAGTAKNLGKDAFLFKLNSDGDSLWCNSYDFQTDPFDCQLNDFLITEEGGFLGVGFWSDQSGPGWTAWMFNTDSIGIITDLFDYSFKKNDLCSEYAVYPNPTSGSILISYKCTNSSFSYSLLDIRGQIVNQGDLPYAKSVDANEVVIRIDKYNPGIYFLIIKSENQILCTKRIVFIR